MSVANPCINICRMDSAGKYCQGCRRTSVEIGLWDRMTEAQRIDILADLPLRALNRAASRQPAPELS
ncbi:DUF1289 domain-containing protein [Cupriavidus sp. BIS7]|uniref:DUF1289 domain-containing protein n=1 Tax=Cupriavidus sp. BIS7 TaxID=1217718 RepID=UPI0002F4EB86|nr:DUF1289 domain-containing protein [Cupriavidus sp. BIS7]